MADLNVNSIGDASGGNTATINGYTPTMSNMAGRNRIINGAMVFDQRNAGAVVTAESYLVDRWRVWRNQAYDIQQVTDAPTGFSNSLKVTKTSTTQSTYGYLVQYVEGFNFADMLFGTANAKTVTLSFWVKSSVTGTFSGGLVNGAPNRTYPATYTISSANTWEYKTITIAGDTSGTWVGSTNGTGVGVWFNFGASGSGTANTWNSTDATGGASGSANLGTTNGATFYITGVQLEAGSVATPFEHVDYSEMLRRCQRYCHAYSSYSLGRARDADTVYGGGVAISPTMRAIPTLRSGATFTVNTGSTGTPQIYSPSGGASSPDSVYLNNASANWTTNALIALTGIFEAEL